MSTSKPRRNKAYKPRSVRIPMMPETRNSLALELHLATEALIAVPSPDTYNQLSMMLAALRRAGAMDVSIDQASDAMLSICDRFDRVGKVGVAESEAAILRQAAGGIDRQIGTVPMNKFKQSVADVSAFCMAIGA
ncbi:hypothetical protein [Collimonas fungivorans]|uniref:Uncharacterized protein n=1 Tax=Collimonas fungivorans (strain Ter331) TaxID=1005048 RepID=G0AAI3_COLFT|nr:hypothetical protein [Collimonas fungivorans]AEK63197.1 hypothetical protein CFU_3373 [Collimonas fungivorans Ter331]